MPEVVIVDPSGTEHHFPEGFDPVRAAGIVRQSLAPAVPQAAQSPMQQLQASTNQNEQAAADNRAGFAQSVAGMVRGGGDLLRRAPLIGSAFNALPSVDTGNALLQPPANANQALAKKATDVAAFFVPGAALGKAKLALQTGSGILDALVGAGLEGASAAGVSSAQKGTTAGASGAAAAGALGTFASNAGLKAAGNTANWLGQRIERALLKPSVASLEGQSEKELVKKIYQYDLGGTLGQTYDKVQAKIQQASDALRGVLKTSSAQGAGVSLNRIAKDVEGDYLDNPQAKAAVSRILDHVEFGLNRQKITAGTGVLDLADANVAKQAVGDMGAWLHDLRGNTVSDADKVTEDVANKFYGRLKTEIEQNATGPVKAYNKVISDLLPIRQAIIRRIPVADRANVLSMADMLGLSAHTLGLSLANRLLNSGLAANLLVKGGALTNTAAAPMAAVVGRGAASQVPQQ